jgi:hypothetical protein
MSERQYNSDEVAAIFERASKTEHADLPAPAEAKGLTLAALQDIGREAGISPESITLAARSLDYAGRLTSKKFMGLPIGVGRTVEFDRPLSDSEWEILVGDLRTTFEARGRLKYDGPFRQWTNGNLQALVEPIRNGHRLRLQTVNGASRARMSAGSALVGGAAATFIALAVSGSVHNPGTVTGIALIALMGLGMFAAGALGVSGGLAAAGLRSRKSSRGSPSQQGHRHRLSRVPARILDKRLSRKCRGSASSHRVLAS